MPTVLPDIESRPKDPAKDIRWALARRIAGSSTFARSEQLRKLLLYVCKMTIADRVDEINEQRIGVEVFGKPRDYDSAIDGIVRSHATRLRQRLELYFSSEGVHEPLRIEIPRGGYVPHFYPVEKAPPAVSGPAVDMEKPSGVPDIDAQVPSSPLESEESRQLKRRWIKPFFTGLFLAALVLLVIDHLRHDAAVATAHWGIRQTEIEQRFWNSLFPPNGKTLIVPGDTGLVLYETLTGHEVTLGDYINGAYRDPSRVTTDLRDSFAPSPPLATSLAARRYTSIVDLDLASQLSHLPQWNRQRASIVFARDLRPQDANSSNLILLGSEEANPWVSLVQPAMNFVLVPDKKWGFHFLNRHPLKGELTEYAPQEGSGAIGAPNVYGDVAYLPNPSGNGIVLVLSGLWMSGTQATGDFVLHGKGFSDWLQSIAKTDGTIPPFEVLIATRSLDSNATGFFVVAQRLYAK